MYKFVLFSLLLFASTGFAETPAPYMPALSAPIKCTFGKDCWVMNYFDADPTKKRADYHCGNMSYDNHTGTDFGLATLAQMRAGVNVLASAPGIVMAFRDGESDQFYKKGEEKTRIKQRECGNAVVLKHSKDLTTQYCHMKKGSVSVKKGDVVERGQKLGEVGLSGKTEFPHVHLSVRYQGKKVDPFQGIGPARKTCRLSKENLWETAPPYTDFALLNAGFTERRPISADARAGKYMPPSLALDTPRVYFWVDLLGVRMGDEVTIALFDPDGKRLARRRHKMLKNQIKVFQFLGKRLKSSAWKKGFYRGVVTLTGKNGHVKEFERRIEMK
ncbi:MAG: M23 family metallopeptidase [Alphaproteobacteria bacterium]